MKKLLFLTLVCSVLAASCEKDYTGDVGEFLTDIEFRKACYDRYDTDNDGKLSVQEVRDVKSILVNGSGVETPYLPKALVCKSYEIGGLSWFSELEDFSYSGKFVKEFDFRENSKLKKLSIYGGTDLVKLVYPGQCIIEDLSFHSKSMADIVIPASVVNLDLYASNIGSLEFGKNASISKFSGQLSGSNMTDLVLPDGLKVIGSYLVYGMERLKSVRIPSSIESIGENAFYNCPGLQQVIIDAATPPKADAAFNYGPEGSDYLIYVPELSLPAYLNAWPQYASRLRGK